MFKTVYLLNFNSVIVFLEIRKFQTGSMVIKWPQNMFFNSPPNKSMRDKIVLPITIPKNAMDHDELE